MALELKIFIFALCVGFIFELESLSNAAKSVLELVKGLAWRWRMNQRMKRKLRG